MSKARMTDRELIEFAYGYVEALVQVGKVKSETKDAFANGMIEGIKLMYQNKI